jgi:hypothetical protein
MATKTPIIAGTNQHVPLASGDTLAGSSIAISTDSGNSLKAGSDGGLFVPTVTPVIPTLTIELGNSGQANGGYGIDQGSYYELDFNIGVTAKNGFPYSVNSDGTFTLTQGGIYLVNGTCKIIAPASDSYSIPAQVILATGQNYAWPGVYQYAVQRYPDLSLQGSGVSGVLGSISLSGTMDLWGAGSPIWLGYSKVKGGSGGNPLQLQGFITYMKAA